MQNPKVEVYKRQTFSGHRNGLFDLVQVDARSFISAGGDGQVVQWQLDEPGEGQVLARVDGTIYCIHYLDGRLLVGENNRAIHLIELANRQVLRSVEVKAPVFAMAHTKERIYVGTGAGELFVFDQSLNFVARERWSEKSLRSIEVWKDCLLLGFSDNRIRLVDQQTMTLLQTIEGHSLSVFAMATRPPADDLLISIGRDAHIRVWDAGKNFAAVKAVPAHMYAINDVVFTDDGQFFFTGSMDKTIKMWDAANFALLKVIDRQRFEGHTNSVNQLLWMAEANLLLSCSDDRTIAAWELKITEKNENHAT